MFICFLYYTDTTKHVVSEGDETLLDFILRAYTWLIAETSDLPIEWEFRRIQ